MIEDFSGYYSHESANEKKSGLFKDGIGKGIRWKMDQNGNKTNWIGEVNEIGKPDGFGMLESDYRTKGKSKMIGHYLNQKFNGYCPHTSKTLA